MTSSITVSHRFTSFITLDAGEGFYIDICFDTYDEVWQIWLSHERFGVKSFMLGIPEISSDGEFSSLEDVIQTAENVLDEYKRIYRDGVMGA